ncbi:hypothetical protein Tco_0068956 [Tanacetum coccineum]
MLATKGDTNITNQSIPMLVTNGDTDITNQSILMLATNGDTDITNQSILMLATNGDKDITNQSIPVLASIVISQHSQVFSSLYILSFSGGHTIHTSLPSPNIALEN